MFDITDVATTGVCTDSFTVTGPTGRNPSVICGVNTGQHSKSIYLCFRNCINFYYANCVCFPSFCVLIWFYAKYQLPRLLYLSTIIHTSCKIYNGTLSVGDMFNYIIK